jgi:hypothetical protein
MSGKEFKIECGIVSTLKDNLVENVIYDNIVIGVEDVMEIKHYSNKLMNKKKYGILIETGRQITVTKDAWTNFNKKIEGENTIAKALVIKNPIYYFLSEVYFTMNSPKVKTKIFTDREKAINWLQKKIKK